MAETRLSFDGIEIAVAKDDLWHVEAAGKAAAARFLDQALELVLPHLTSQQRDALVLGMLTLGHPWQSRD